MTANKPVQLLDAASSLSPTDVVHVVVDPASTPVDKKAAVSLLASAIHADGAINFTVDGGGATIATGLKGFLRIPFACTITAVTMLADQTGSIVVDVWKDTYANHPPTDADSITALAQPTISADVKSQDSTLTDWTTEIAAGDILAFNVDSCTAIQRLSMQLHITKS
jgi:hypothetical protein